MTPVIRLFATRSKRHDFSLQFQGSQSDLWGLFSHPLHHKLRNYSRRFFCVIRAGEPELCSLCKPTLNEGHWAGLLSESATFATARRGRAAPATTGSRSVPRPPVREAILKPAPPRHATTGANAKRRPPQPPNARTFLKPRPSQPPTTGTLLKPRPPQPPTTGTLLKPRPPQRNQTRLKTWFHGQQGWRRFRPHQSQAQQGRYGLHREHPPTTRAARLQPAPPLRTAAGANAKPRPPQPPTTGTFLKPRPPQRNQTRLKTWFHGQQGWRKFQSNQLQVQQGWPGFSYPYRQANQAAAVASLPPRSRQARSSQNGSTRSIHSEGGGEAPIIDSMTEIAFLLTATSRFYPIEACAPVDSGTGETTVSE